MQQPQAVFVTAPTPTQGTVGKLVGCKPGQGYGGFVLGWFLVPFLIAMVIGLLIEYFSSSAKCVDGKAFQTVTLISFAIGVVTGIIAFVVHRFRCKTP